MSLLQIKVRHCSGHFSGRGGPIRISFTPRTDFACCMKAYSDLSRLIITAAARFDKRLKFCNSFKIFLFKYFQNIF